MKHARRTQADRTAATRAALIRAGRDLFAAHGFAGVGTGALVAAAGVSRGALYHQFGSKLGLFEAVLAELEGAVTAEVADVALAGDSDITAVMVRATEAWLDACERTDVQKIVLIDGPSVLGWTRWREICQPYMLGLVEGVLAQGMADGTLRDLPVRPLAHVLLAVADEAALYVDGATDRATARTEIMTVVRPLIEALRPT